MKTNMVLESRDTTHQRCLKQKERWYMAHTHTHTHKLVLVHLNMMIGIFRARRDGKRRTTSDIEKASMWSKHVIFQFNYFPLPVLRFIYSIKFFQQISWISCYSTSSWKMMVCFMVSRLDDESLAHIHTHRLTVMQNQFFVCSKFFDELSSEPTCIAHWPPASALYTWFNPSAHLYVRALPFNAIIFSSCKTYGSIFRISRNHHSS